MEDEASYMRERWRCSACGSLNHLERDNVCWRCMEKALEDDAEKLRAFGEDGNGK
jgi:uncharacterized paraquat-inducible protein A